MENTQLQVHKINFNKNSNTTKENEPTKRDKEIILLLKAK